MLNNRHHTPQIHHRPSNPSQTAAFFDVDGTLLPGTYAERIFIRYLVEKKVLTWRHLARYAISVLAGGNLCQREAWERNKTYLKGQRTEAIRQWAERCIQNRIQPRLSPKALATVEDHLCRGHRVFFISASLSYLVKPLQKHLGAHGMLATELISKDDRLTGQIDGSFLYGRKKVELIRQRVSQWHIALDLSFAYSDHHSDIPLLEMVGQPVAVNPDGKLRRHALRNGWRVVMFSHSQSHGYMNSL